MTLPLNPNTVYAALSQVKSLDLNDIQTAIAELHAGPWVRKSFYPWPMPSSIAVATAGEVAGDGMYGYRDDAQTSIFAAGAGGSSGAVPGTQYPRWVLKLFNAAVSDGCRLFSSSLIFGVGLDDRVFVAEWESMIGSAGGTAVGANNVDIFMGLHTDPGAVTPDTLGAQRFAMFQKKSAETNWQLNVSDVTTGTITDLGVPPVEDAVQNFRLEYHGVNTPIGVLNSAATVRVFIEGIQVAEVTDGNVPSGGTGFGLTFQMYADSTGPDADIGLAVSPVNVAWNMR